MQQLDSSLSGSRGSLAGRKRLGAPPLAFFSKSPSMGSLAEFDKVQDVGNSQEQNQSQNSRYHSHIACMTGPHWSEKEKDNSAFDGDHNEKDDVCLKHTRSETNVDKAIAEQGSKFKFKHEDIQVIQTLGAGSGGSVSKVLHKPSNLVMARKIVKIEGALVHGELQDKIEKRILRELRILKLCRSPEIVSFYGAFMNEGDLCIMMEYMDVGSLDSIYQKTGPIPEYIIGAIGHHILLGLIYLYENHKIVHRDIKPSNILVNTKGQIKIADFGVSKELSNGTIARTFTGTQGYLAPERIHEGSVCTPASDVWSVGLTLMELALGHFPIPNEAVSTVFDLLQFIEDEPSPTLPQDGRFSQEFHSFVNQCLIKDPASRPHPKKLLSEPFIQINSDKNKEIKAWIDTVYKPPIATNMP